MGAAASQPWSDENIWADLYEPTLAWATVYEEGLAKTADSSASIRGVTGRPVIVQDLDREPEPIVPLRTLTWGRALRHRVILGWLGAALLVIAGLSILAAATWEAPTVAGMGGALGLFGALATITSLNSR
jgi:hypothetical protein